MTLGKDHGRRVGREVRFGVLGPVTATEGTNELSIGGPKQRAVLAMLIAHVGDPVSADAIIEAVWGDEASSNARRIAQSYVATLRSEVGDAIVKAGRGWRLVTSRAQIDSLAFEDLYVSAREMVETSPQRASVALREGLAMWRGHPYSDIEGHGALDGEVARLLQLRVAAQAARIDADLALGRDADLIGEIEALMVEHPYSERFRVQHMLALYRAGRQREALQSYETMRMLLVEELGVDPTFELRDLERRILDQDDSLQVEASRTVQRRAILVADPGDPIEIGHLTPTEREDLLTRTDRSIQSELVRVGDGVSINAGFTTYVIFKDALTAANVAESLARRLDRQAIRLAIDFGDVVLEGGGVSGPPVSRGAVMTAVAHNGQVLLSVDAQQAIGTSGSGRGLRFENLGDYDLHGIEGSLVIYQLLVGDRPPVYPDLETHRLPPPLPGGRDRSVPGYELREVYAPGSIGTLYRAFQPSLGRDVLVEVIARAVSSGANFIRSFEADAQALSLLDHQNISSVVDYWRQPEGAFMVYPYPGGGLLSHQPNAEAARIVEQIGSALAYAHSLGMIHGSLRPDRVALDEAGNASLLCFSIAHVDPAPTEEYREYLAPELDAGGAMTSSADLYSLGVLARGLGFGGSAIDRATRADPDQRHGSVVDFLIDLNPVDSESPGDRYTETRNPYRGLAAFQERDAADFYGRSSAVDELCSRLGGSHVLAIVGPSGIGKSSVARAGLIPALRTGRLPGSETWLITDMLPGVHPFIELQRALEKVAVDLPIELTEALAFQEAKALSQLSQGLPEGTDLVVLIDQFEELFTMTSESERVAFLDLLTQTVRDRSARFVLTLRADFLDRPLLYSEFGELLKQSTVMIPASNPDELVEAIAKPAAGVGVEMAPELVERMVAEVHNQAGALPLLQHTLAEVFARRRTDLIGLSEFDEIGGVTGSVARRAESIYDDLSAFEQSTVKQVFLRLVTVVDDAAPTRRRIRVTDLADIGGEEAMEAFARSRLLVFDNDPDTRTPTVEVAHEALLTHWPRLAGWIDAAREDLAMARRLEEARREWEGADRDDTYLLTGGRLAQHMAWTTTTTLVLSQSDNAYLEASRTHDEKIRARSRRRRGLVMAGFGLAAAVALLFALSASDNARRAESERLVANAILATEIDPELALLLALQAYEGVPSSAAQSAIHQGLQTQRGVMVIDPPPGSIGAIAAIDPAGKNVAVAGLRTGVVQLWEIGADESTWEVTVGSDDDAFINDHASIWFSADGESVFVPLSPRTLFDRDGPNSPGAGLYELDVSSGEMVRFREIPCLFRVSPAGTNFASGPLFAIDYLGATPDGTCDILGGAAVFDFDSGEKLFSVQVDAAIEPTLSADGQVMALTGGFFSGGPYARLADVPEDTPYFFGVRVYDTTNGEALFELEEFAYGLVSPDGESLLTDRDPSYLHDLASGERLQTYQGDFVRFRFVADASRVVAPSPASGAVHVFDTVSGAELLVLRGHTASVRRVDLSADGLMAVSSGFDAARVWDSDPSLRGDLSSIELPSYDDPSFYIDDVVSAFYLDALSASDDLLLTRRAGINFIGAPAPPIPYRADVIAKDDGEHLWGGDVWAAELGNDGIAYVQRVLETEVVSPVGIERAIRIGRPELIEARTGRHLRFLEGCEHFWVPADDVDDIYEPEPGCEFETSFDIFNVQFSADGSTLSGATIRGEVVVWDVRSGKIVRWDEPALGGLRFRAQGYRWPAALSPDGDQVIVPPSDADWANYAETGQRPLVKVQGVVSRAEQAEFEVERWIDFLTYVPETGNIVGSDTDLLVIDPASWEVTRMTRSQGAAIADLAVSPSGLLAATVSLDSFVAVWDLEEGRIVAEFPVLGEVGEGLRGVAFIDDTTIAVAPEISDRLIVFTLDDELLITRALEKLNRPFRSEECATYKIDPCPTLEEMQAR